ncbi:MAG: serine hydrolase [Bacteroidota bacterium]
MKRLLLFVSTFLLAAILIGGTVYWLNRGALDTVFENRNALSEGNEWVELTFSMQGVTDYISQHPDRISIYRHRSTSPEPDLDYRADERRALGQLTGFHAMIALAGAFEEGALDPGETVRWESIRAHQLPGWGSVEIETAQKIADQTDTPPTLADLPALWAASNSPAIHDYLLHRIGPDRLTRTFDRLGLEKTDLPIPFSGLMLTLSPVVQGIDAVTIFDHWTGQSRPLFEEEAWSNSESFASGNRREKWIQRIEEQKLGLDFYEQRDRLALYPKSTARETGELLLRLSRLEVLSEEVSRRVLGWMERPLPEDPPTSLSSYHGLFDHRIGLLSGLDLGTDRTSGETTAQVSLFDQLQIAVWFHLSSNHMHQYLHRQMLEEPRLVTDIQQQLLKVAS